MRTIYYVAGLPFSSELYHHGIIGQKWGVRRFQNLDGTLTEEGRARYRSSVERQKFSDDVKKNYLYAPYSRSVKLDKKLLDMPQIKDAKKKSKEIS